LAKWVLLFRRCLREFRARGRDIPVGSEVGGSGPRWTPLQYLIVITATVLTYFDYTFQQLTILIGAAKGSSLSTHTRFTRILTGTGKTLVFTPSSRIIIKGELVWFDILNLL